MTITPAPHRSRARRALQNGLTGLGAGVAALLASAGVAVASPTPTTAPAAAPVAAHVAVTRLSAAGSSLTVSAPHAVAGSTVTISGDAPRDAHAGEWITLQSDVFAAQMTYQGIPAIRTQVTAQGTYRVTVKLSDRLPATSYAIAGSFRAHAFDQVAWLQIHG